MRVCSAFVHWPLPMPICHTSAPVAQLDRASASGAEGHRFESCRARQPSLTLANESVSYGWQANFPPYRPDHQAATADKPLTLATPDWTLTLTIALRYTLAHSRISNERHTHEHARATDWIRRSGVACAGMAGPFGHRRPPLQSRTARGTPCAGPPRRQHTRRRGAELDVPGLRPIRKRGRVSPLALATCLGKDPMFFAVIDRAIGKATGVASYLRIQPENGSIEVGHINFSPLLQRNRAATEAMYLMMKHAFDLGYRRYEWKCDALNAPSRAAAQRLGLSYKGSSVRQRSTRTGTAIRRGTPPPIRTGPRCAPRSTSGWTIGISMSRDVRWSGSAI